MKRTLFVTLIGLTFTLSSLHAQMSATLSFSGPAIWTPGTSVTLQCTDTFLNFGGSYGLSYWLEVSSALAPFLTITSLTYHEPFTDGNNIWRRCWLHDNNDGAWPER